MSTEKRFDYRAACRELAEPAVRALPDSVLSIYRALRDHPEYDKLAQASDLNVPMPDSLRERFAQVTCDGLALAAQVLYHFGHWGGRLDGEFSDKRGATWKFANLADGVLRSRLRVPDHGPSLGYTFEIHQGALRLCISTPDSWQWQDIGPATPERLQLALEWLQLLPQTPPRPYSRRSQAWQDFESAAYKVTRALPQDWIAGLPEPWARWMNAGVEFTREEGKCSDDCAECGTSQLFSSAAANHAITCSHYPMESRIDAVLRHGPTFGLTAAQIDAARAAILATPR